MENQDQRRTHTQGNESLGVYVCHKCGWPFPNPHPSAKHRHAHKKNCGTIEGYKVLVSEGQTDCNASDDEHLSEDDHIHKTQGPKNALDTGKDEKGSGGIGEKTIRSGDGDFSDAVTDFSDGGLSPGIKECLRDCFSSATDVEIPHRNYAEFSGSCEDKVSNVTAVDVSPLIVKSRNDGQMQDPNILHGESVEERNMVELEGQLSGSNPLSSPVAVLKTVELTVAHSDDCFGLSIDSNASKSEATLENKLYAGGQSVSSCSGTSFVKEEAIMKGKDEIRSDTDVVEIGVTCDNTIAIGETCEQVTKITVSNDTVNSDCQVADEAFTLKEKNSVPLTMLQDVDVLPLELNSAVITYGSTNGDQVELPYVAQFSTPSNVKMLQERGEENINVFALPSHDQRPDVVYPRRSVCEDFRDHEGVVVPQNYPSLHSFEALEPEGDYLKDSVPKENDLLFNQSQMSEKREVLSQDTCALDSSNMEKEQVQCELMSVEMHAEGEGSIEVSPVKCTVESNNTRFDETGASMKAKKPEMNESHMVHFSEQQGSDGVSENSQQTSLPECSFMAASNENPNDASFEPEGSETTSVIRIDNVSVDDKCREASVEHDIGLSIETPQPGNLHSEVKPSSSGVYKCDETVEMGGDIEKCDITDAQYPETIVKGASEVVLDGSERKPIVIEVTSGGLVTVAQEDMKKDDETNSHGKVNKDCNTLADTCADYNHEDDSELLVEDMEILGRNHSPLSSLNIEPSSAQQVSTVVDTQSGEPRREGHGVISMPVQDQSGNNDVKIALSAIYTSVDGPGSRCEYLEANLGSVSVISLQSDAQAVIDAEALRTAEAVKFNLKEPKAASETQEEIFEPSSFMTLLVKPGHVVGPEAAPSEVKIGPYPQHLNSTCSQAGWFPTLTHVSNESQGRKKNQEIIAKVTSSSTVNKQTQAAHSCKPMSQKLQEKSVNQKNGSGLTTINTILVCESPGQTAKGESGKEWKSPARYSPSIKREKKKVKSRPYWIQFVCCSSVDSK